MKCYTPLMVCIAVTLPTAAIFILDLDCRPLRQCVAHEWHASVDACDKTVQTANRRLSSRVRQVKEAGSRELYAVVNQKTLRRLRAYWHMAAALCLLLLIDLRQKGKWWLPRRGLPARSRH